MINSEHISNVGQHWLVLVEHLQIRQVVIANQEACLREPFGNDQRLKHQVHLPQELHWKLIERGIPEDEGTVGLQVKEDFQIIL